MAKTHFLRFLLAGQEDDLICEVRKPESDRLKRVLEGEHWANRRFWFDTIDGRSILVNLKHLQGVRFLWNVAPRPPDSRIDPEEPMKIVLVGNKAISEPPPEIAKDLYTLFWELELGNDEVVTFMDVDGEYFSLVPDQIVYLSAPKEVVDEGRREANEEDGLEP